MVKHTVKILLYSHRHIFNVCLTFLKPQCLTLKQLLNGRKGKIMEEAFCKLLHLQKILVIKKFVTLELIIT